MGLDVVLDIENHYAAQNSALPAGPRELLHRYVDAGHLGVKTGYAASRMTTTPKTDLAAELANQI